MRKILLATALLGSLMVPMAGTADAAKVFIGPFGGGAYVGPGPYVGPGYVGPGYVAPGVGIGWLWNRLAILAQSRSTLTRQGAH